MIVDSGFILFKKTDFNTVLACSGVRCIGGGGGGGGGGSYRGCNFLMKTFL